MERQRIGERRVGAPGAARPPSWRARFRHLVLEKWLGLHRPIRVKVLIGLALLLLAVVCAASTGLYATYSYRSLVKGLSYRAVELPMATKLSQLVGDLRNTLGELRGIRAARYWQSHNDRLPIMVRLARDQFASQLDEVETTLADYRQQLEHKFQAELQISEKDEEWETLHRIETGLAAVDEAHHKADWLLDDVNVDRLDRELERLQMLVAELPGHLHMRLRELADDVRGQYRLLLIALWINSILAAVIFTVCVRLFYRWIFRPLNVLIGGSRRVASGEFHYRIRLQTADEMAELASAMNSMTSRFQAIRDDLDHQVQDRTKQVVRSEQLASVGFLAAGVAHEINNPLASIALCAESLEGRVVELLDSKNPDHQVVAKYLRMIQDEAFRCKQITEKLLDFSRVGEVRRQDADLNELVQSVIEMLRHLGRYQRKRLTFQRGEPVISSVNAQEIKQVVLNLLTNALDCIDDDGTVSVTVSSRDGFAEIAVVDNGCGMAPAVLEHVFEPFFTRRKAGQGTGLGLSISYRIVTDHGGELEAQSEGPGLGATFRVRLPLAASAKEISHRHQAA